ncbi:hypothetical protein THAOC_14584 [Thalassiosira oceanica]|uniref:FAD/NAD(P)-binding domain-containing protein n=1 Tax=Thalassiosira oceanica TaxID=159749 RepID=K0SI74_THAOC|nr:hypothetical protein THAOC_14584 [Thalassiosira oceanica]|eukprot:EJK64659.1 hypothetical protein THAOC_14584 [Thalassiosira oceanica]
MCRFDPGPVRIAVIGGGPSGLFFAHAVNKILSGEEDNFERRRIEITIFEKSSRPGGVWQSSAEAVDNDVACYDNLWTNGASHSHEFPDYTYDEHFGRPVDVYMRRKDLLEYILGRVTQGNANFFDDHVVTNTEVIKARYIKERCKFEVRTRNVKTGVENNIQYFDKCVWAAGDNGLRYFPQKLVDQVLRGGFSGRIIHSTDMREFEKDVKGKRIVLIGGGLSAEDLALQAVKVGVNHVTIVVRDARGGDVAGTRIWPYDKVNVLRGMTVTGSEGERKIRLSKSSDLPEVDESKGCLYLDDIDTIILCTGYSVNQNMLSMENTHKLRRDFGDMEEELLLPDDWKMDHPLDKITGDTEPDAGYYSPRTSPDYYNGVSMTNPNMMFMSYNDFWWPLLAIDVYANILAGVCCGTVKLPTLEDARRQNYEESLRQMRDPMTRYYMDDNYSPFQKFDELTNAAASDGSSSSTAPDAQYHDELWGDLPVEIKAAYEALGYSEDYWCNGGDEPAAGDKGWSGLNAEEQAAATVLGYDQGSWDSSPSDSIYYANILFSMEALDERMKLVKYPLRLIEEGGLQVTFEDIRQCHPFEWGKLPPGLTSAGGIFYIMTVNSGWHRWGEDDGLTQNKETNPLTYRDYTNGQDFHSMHTGTRARPSLESTWLSL